MHGGSLSDVNSCNISFKGPKLYTLMWDLP